MVIRDLWSILNPYLTTDGAARAAAREEIEPRMRKEEATAKYAKYAKYAKNLNRNRKQRGEKLCRKCGVFVDSTDKRGLKKEDGTAKYAKYAKNPDPFPQSGLGFAYFAVLYRRIVQFQQDFCRKGTQRTQRQGLMQFILCDFCVLLRPIPVWLRLCCAKCFAV